MNRKQLNFVIVMLAALAFGACRQDTADNITITHFLELSAVNDPDNPAMQNYAEYDSVAFSDGSYAVHLTGRAPMNQLTEFFDSHGRTIATISRASECYAQALAYNYDDKGRIRHIICFNSEMFDGLDSCQYQRDRNGYLGFRQMLENLDYSNPDTANYTQTNIEYDKQGNAVRMYTPLRKNSIDAPKGYRLIIELRECSSFWASDIRGGTFNLHVTREPINRNASNYQTDRFLWYMPTVTFVYRNGEIHEATIFEENRKPRKFLPKTTNGINVYTIHQDNGDCLQTAFKGGKLTYEQKVSKYGTILSRNSYTYNANGTKAIVTHEKIDYATRQLHRQYTTTECVEKNELSAEERYIMGWSSSLQEY